MKKIAILALAGVLGVSQPVFAQAMMAQQAPMTKIDGVIAAVNGNEVDVTARDGSKFAVDLGDKTRIVYSVPISIDQIKKGSFIGAGAQADGKGGNDAMEITVFPESMRGVGEGFHKWDQGPKSTMTNGTVATVEGTSGRTLTVTYKGGKQKVTVAPQTPIITFDVADKTALTPGAHVTVRGFKAGNGKINAGFLTVGKNGSVPPV